MKRTMFAVGVAVVSAAMAVGAQTQSQSVPTAGQSSNPDKITVTGCLEQVQSTQRRPQYRLTNVTVGRDEGTEAISAGNGTTAAAGQPALSAKTAKEKGIKLSTYQISPETTTDLSKYVGHKVEAFGSVDRDVSRTATGAAANTASSDNEPSSSSSSSTSTSTSGSARANGSTRSARVSGSASANDALPMLTVENVKDVANSCR